MTGFQYFSLVFFIFLAQMYRDRPGLIDGITFVLATLTLIFMISGK
jgi:hypothetical protein